ncbi:DNA-binding protein [Novosphingobium sp. PC22D]|uniref:Zn-ribbon domain-containing OB-fold protein n=1 Tax=Novosphingobium sp. PC22D TaxID=1962403 RepID=UPI000BF0F59C|nr:OB-fold domain-containing protein [Novosphingobium sp. PC22D]PEQ11519.1 DNA-binding protein [Novosphingobium sp. PC22D]
MNPPRPVPKLDDANRAFWTGGAEGKLNITRCGDCGQYTHPPQILCRHCQSENVAPEAVAGTGAVETMSVNHQPWAKGLEVPYVIARVRLDGVPGVYLTTNIVNCEVDEVAFDDPVRVVFEEQDGIFYPLFEKAD